MSSNFGYAAGKAQSDRKVRNSVKSTLAIGNEEGKSALSVTV